MLGAEVASESGGAHPAGVRRSAAPGVAQAAVSRARKTSIVATSNIMK